MAEFTPQPSCADDVDHNNLTVEQARQRIHDLLSPISSWQKVSLRQALGQVLHQSVVSPRQVPPYNNSAMDGYALQSADIKNAPFSLNNVGVAFAGKPYQGHVEASQCIRIMTGAKIPDGCDTVVMQEQVESDNQTITIHTEVKAGQNVRLAGEDIDCGDTVLPAGRRLTPADLGLLASLGIAEVVTYRPLRVAFFSTGDELCGLGEHLGDGQIYDSNRYTLYGMLSELNIDVIDMGVFPDNRAALKIALEQAAADADVIISSGGVSVGDADYVKDMLAELGQVNFWKIAMRPGRPLAFGQIGEAMFFGLPGNPVSVMVTFYQFVQPALKRLAGESDTLPIIIEVPCDNAIKKRAGRFEFQRGILFRNNEGQLRVSTTGAQGSGILRSMSMANCFILLEENCDGLSAGSLVNVQPFAGLV
ncbi:MAG: bifunctional molybdopterin-guanine dinucleotide biosynthesis adaptor protein MobB/molybdopterin molybdotransferase MoeA [Methylophaga sp.]|uniref:molybdopterin molybdotransferase MoeA n=1 Tax=Methylophaga sp. UBA678 TaxID=1946901 RepID=UPI000C4B845A|nr:bifunctional molybdopterin-guanine dinucleotide biosynthesis adaptor protein MobB/molybdopterin molybdotransferase MoeA [Methylophaga sp. UBA678]MAX53206.1 bifunctional molybdopterin-guanine dinucleotide biosynthesis adaptor protein MobB/molybdopterin molybdotransferase MoeA [Methylophaga sp.]